MDPGRRRTAVRRLWTAVAAAFTLPLTMLATGTPAAHAASVQCSVDYKTNDWGSGFTADLTITNRGTDAIDGWTLTYAYAGNQKLTNGWNGTWSQSGQTVTVKNASYNGGIAAGAAVSTGAQFTYTGTNAAPTSFAVNGTTCAGAHQPPVTVLTSPSAGAVYSQGEAVPLAATAAAADNATIGKVEFYDDTTLLGTDTSAPYSLSVSSLTVGSHSLVAKAYDSLGASAASTPVGITVASGPAVVASPSQLGVQQGESGTFSVKLSTQPSANVTVSTSRTSGNTGLSVTGGSSLTFTPSNWNTAQTVTVTADSSGTGSATFTASATGHSKATVTVTELPASKAYDARFLDLYGKITNPANGYFSPEGIPYHAVETLIVEAPDQGHETTSEAYSYLLWLQAMYGKVTGDWSKFNGAWDIMEKYMIPTHADQPTNSFYNASKPATYAPELDTPNEYPAKLDSSVPVGTDPIAGELKSAYGTDDVYGMHWIQDVDNVYGYGNEPGTCEAGPTATGPSYINTFQRGAQESVWETVPQPTCDAFKYGGKNGYLDLFTGDSSYARQWKYTDAPDADSRAVQAAYWADVWAKAQGKGSDVSTTVAKAAKMGDYLRYAMYDKYFKKIGNCTSPSCPAGTGKDASHYLLSWYYAWGGATDTSAGWAWRIGSSRLPEPPRRLRAQLGRRPEAQVGDGRGGLGQVAPAAARVLPVAPVVRGRHRGRRDQQLAGPVRDPAGRRVHLLRHVLRLAARLPRPAVQPVVRLPGVVDGAGRRVLPADRERHGQGDPRQVGQVGAVQDHDQPGRHLPHPLHPPVVGPARHLERVESRRQQRAARHRRGLHRRRRRGRRLRQDADVLRRQVR